ncbi:hypothetical protein LY90DRAFT_636661 [Neocallimastix californiae]|uniref:UNC-45/Cro1/She4 central domain-containing protein n=1 Tax=Neocallimastix californiae TaxID=1754190 RepID=A0A1Y2EPA0_9FUNG|nr:hypothetical protein LY90DRAFT_636661 [Neocallimastix californiae]|eukprot:ORY73026.1 hypothetical protein LY90DRAFT_636661 [Neocallimastix californiae]
MLVEEIEETNNSKNSEHSKNTVDSEKIKEQIKKCMLLLQRHTKDEEKFVALLILPKLLNPKDKELMSIVFKEIDFVFLRRLLISDNSDNNSESQSSLYKIISLNIISSFCYYPEFLNEKRIIKTIPYLISILNENEDLEVTLEILDIFILFTTNENTLREISIPESIKRINNLIINSNHDEIKDKSIKILLYLCQSKYCNSVITIIPKLSEYFIKNNSEFKFRILEIFVALFANMSLNKMRLPDNNQWLLNITKALKIILSNKLGSSQMIIVLF